MGTSDKLPSVIKNSYGNFVVQKALKIATGEDKQNLVNSILKVLHLIQDKKIRTKWEQIIADAQSSSPHSQDFELAGHRQIGRNMNRAQSND